MPNPFRDSRNRYLTKSLFLETKTDLCEPIFTLDSKTDVDGIVSVYRLYMEADDPTEYTVAMTMLGDLQHWKVLTEREFFKPYLEQWREELQARIRSQAVRVIRETSATPTPGALPSAKWLTEADLLEGAIKRGPGKGRPKKEKPVFEMRASDLEDDAERISL